MRAVLLAATLLAPLPALAVVDPSPGPKDSRVRSVAYDQKQVVRLTSTGLSPLEVVFESGEKPVFMAGAMLSDSKEPRDWVVRPSGNVIVLQPIRMMEPSVLFVRTVTAEGTERHYTFELRTRDGDVTDQADKSAYMAVQVAYKHVPTPAEMAAWRARQNATQSVAEQREVRGRLQMAQSAPVANTNYDMMWPDGCPGLRPMSIYDDGHRTTMDFAPHADLPEVYILNQDGKEAIVTTVNETTARGLRVVVPSVMRDIRLRRGGKVCALRNNAFDQIGTQPGGGSGTVSPNVVRQLRASQ